MRDISHLTVKQSTRKYNKQLKKTKAIKQSALIKCTIRLSALILCQKYFYLQSPSDLQQINFCILCIDFTTENINLKSENLWQSWPLKESTLEP